MLHILELSPSITPAPVAPCTFTHIVTLINRATGDEKLLEIVTLSDRFCDVMRQVLAEKARLRLGGYEVYEALCQTDAF